MGFFFFLIEFAFLKTPPMTDILNRDTPSPVGHAHSPYYLDETTLPISFYRSDTSWNQKCLVESSVTMGIVVLCSPHSSAKSGVAQQRMSTIGCRFFLAPVTPPTSPLTGQDKRAEPEQRGGNLLHSDWRPGRGHVGGAAGLLLQVATGVAQDEGEQPQRGSPKSEKVRGANEGNWDLLPLQLA